MVRLLDIGVKTEYAVRALVNLQKAGPDAVVTVKDLAEKSDISVYVLYSIFDMLERHSIVRGHKGRQRGFSLGRPDKEISFVDILTAVEGSIEKRQCLLDRRQSCQAEKPCAAHQIWQDLREGLEKKLGAVTLDQMAKGNIPWERV
jgi:Rrf2 family protein